MQNMTKRPYKYSKGVAYRYVSKRLNHIDSNTYDIGNLYIYSTADHEDRGTVSWGYEGEKSPPKGIAYMRSYI